MIVDNKPTKVFEKPTAGLYDGVLADIVYIKDKPTSFGLKNVARFVWILSAKDTEGNPFRVMREVNQSLDESSHLFGLARDIRNGVPPPVPFELDELLGTQSQIVITRSTGVNKKTGKPVEYANVANVLPGKAGVAVAVPQGFVRDKDKPAKGSQPVQGSQNTQAATSASTVASPAAAASQQDDSEEVAF